MKWYPLIFVPVYKDYIWGGSRIPALYRRPVPPGVYAESWELSDRPEGMSIAENGPLAGHSLHELIAGSPRELLGSSTRAPVFPLLIKLIDARERLSLQVHPDDKSGPRYGGEAKTEAWHAIETAPGARVFAGLANGVTEADFRAALAAGRLEPLLQAHPFARGDTIFIPGGRVHAIGEGALLLEVQQNSNTTYRVYDWGRVGNDGKPRELHVEKALQVIRWQDSTPVRAVPSLIAKNDDATVTELVTCPYFRLERLELSGPFAVRHNGESFHAIFAARGDVGVELPSGETTVVPYGRTALIAAAITNYTLHAARGMEVLRISVPSEG